MAENVRIKNSLKNTPVSPRGEREKLMRILLVAAVVVLGAGTLFFALFGLRKVLFTGNPRLTLRKVTVETTGYWENRERELAARLNLHTGDNLFSINIRKVRQELQKIPNVESCEVIRTLPDRIDLKIVERIPRAVLKNPRSPWVLDENGIVIPRLESLCVQQKTFLPVLHTGIRNIIPGQPLEELKPALDLIMLSVRSFPDIQIISVENPDDHRQLRFHMRYRRSKICTVTMPVRSNMSFLLTALQSAILSSEQQGRSGRYFNLLYDGSVVIK
ncbi:MAG: FtsQ-type POTRA domain-containing protein [Lentisphaeria bacterium]|nr:FtsQ-type POTRA domain-containing protein [Lentisphaeria bacterium]MBQ8755317.1 FtsQ-type POTRA domain-containing protein [Lentisphaeria bacterium]MBQ9775979.1 FtsQ-type POTRA domain-containing protein [Lentisphaeria bacterium]